VGWSDTSKCKCPIFAKINRADYRLLRGQGKTGSETYVQLDFQMDFNLPEPEKCECVKVRVLQIVGRFKTGNDDFTLGLNPKRNERTVKTGPQHLRGWRVDWPLGAPVQVPFVDNTQHADAWTPESPDGMFHDGPEGPLLRNSNRRFSAYTCFVGEKQDESREWLGCVHWGFKRTGDDHEPQVDPEPEEPQWICGKPEQMDRAIERWNLQNPGHKVPDISITENSQPVEQP